MTDAFRQVGVTRVQGARLATATDCVAVEEPLEVRLHGRPFAVLMRTPGADRELTAGFLLSERVIGHPDDLGAIRHCQDAAAEHPENIVDVRLADATGTRLDAVFTGQRHVVMNASCGMCGRLTIESLRVDLPPIESALVVSSSVIAGLPDALRARQQVFARTGGLHAAGLFAVDGTLRTLAEDVGRHNAVDKVIGRMIMSGALPIDDAVLFVSGRTSFEIVQKAFLAGLAVVAAVSAPSSLAIELAEAAGITLVGFVRGETFNVYTHPSRIG